MEVQSFTDPRAYFDAAVRLTEGREAASAMFLSIAQAEARAHEQVPSGHFLLAVAKDGRHIAFALSTRVKSLLMLPWSDEAKQQADTICAAIADFLEAHPEFPMECVCGVDSQAEQMVATILVLPGYQGRSVKHTEHLVAYQLTPATIVVREQLDVLEPVHFRQAVAADAPRVGALLHEFYVDTNQAFSIGQPAEEYEKEARSHIEKGNAYVWCSEDGEVCALAVTGEPTSLGHRINRVHTVRHARQRGYARNVVTAVCRKLFRNPDCHVVLLMAKENDEAPNRCYRSIGFQQHDRFAELLF